MARGIALASMLRSLGITGALGIVALVLGFAVVGYHDPVLAGGLVLIFLGAALVIHAAVRAIAARFGMGGVV